MKMKKCCFVIPYFGVLPKSFPIFLKTCAWNPDFNWILFTDDNTAYDYPDNVTVVQMTLEELNHLADRKFGFHVALKKAYKLCDFKPAYGFLFEEWLKDYRFWGHCDIDTVMGNLSHFLTDDLLEEYDKLFCMGHFVIYRNEYSNNRVFMNRLNGIELYKKVFTTSDICWFDEEWNGKENINRMFLDAGKRVLQKDWSANFNVRTQRFNREIYYLDSQTEDIVHVCEGIKDALYFWDRGGAYRTYIEKGLLRTDEFMYMHFQWRNMRIVPPALNSDCFKIVPNAFIAMKERPSNIRNFGRIRKWSVCFYKAELWYKEHFSRRFNKLINFLQDYFLNK